MVWSTLALHPGCIWHDSWSVFVSILMWWCTRACVVCGQLQSWGNWVGAGGNIPWAPCKWFGVVCATFPDGPHVVELNLVANNLVVRTCVNRYQWDACVWPWAAGLGGKGGGRK